MKKCTAFILMLLINMSFGYAQTKLSELDLVAFKDRAKVSVRHLQNYIIMLASKTKDSIKKTYYKEEALKLFKNRGNDVIMEVSTLKNEKESRVRLPLIKYFDNIISLTETHGKYAQVSITFAETWRVSNLHKIDDKKYRATATIFQKFVGYGADGTAKYEDTTKKTIEIDVEKITDLYGERWIVLLGDISVAETSR